MSKENKNKSKAPKGTLAEQLKKLEKDKKLADREAEKRNAPTASSVKPKTSARKLEAARQPDKKPAAPTQPEQAPLSDEDLFKFALNSVEDGDIFRAKYEGESKPLPPAVEKPVEQVDDASYKQPLDDESARKLVFEERDRAIFERQIGAVIPVENKLHKAIGRRRKDVHAATRGFSDEPAGDLITPNLPRTEPGLSNPGPYVHSQREMLRRFQKASIAQESPLLNLRGDSLVDALRQLELFMHREWKSQAGFVRIIHGRGLRSECGAIIKPAVLEWLEGPGLRYVRGYIPELTASGDYGSLIVELTARENGES